ncbi:MAG: DUF5615 family PIN-like protein [Chloroflexota bacterium]|nr:DUF5615 family PIN-like protein [Chloroflexota bacterium]
MKIRFLLDENLSPRLITALKRLNTNIDVIRVGDENAPPFAASDSDILKYLISAQRIMVTGNRSTIPDQLREHYTLEGKSQIGILFVRPNSTISQLAESLHLVWIASELEEWIDRIDWIPF